VNTAEVLPGDFTRNPDYSLPSERLKRGIAQAAGKDRSFFVDAQKIAVTLFGQSIAANMFLLGYAYQQGSVPLSAPAIERAIELNGEAMEMNIDAFRWGRGVAQEPALAGQILGLKQVSEAQTLSQSLQDLIARRVAFLTDYQDAAYADRYAKAIGAIRDAEGRALPGRTELTEAAARALFKLMAYKDEYEVARLYAAPSFAKQLKDAFDGETMRLTFHLAPPLLARKNPSTGLPMKITFGPWMLKAFRVLAKFKGLRGTACDPFGYTQERRDERRRIEDYLVLLNEFCAKLHADNHAIALELAKLPERIRGFGHVRARNAQEADAAAAGLIVQWRAGLPALSQAAE
jgi:indolepyruvate ferredoxin oxidoreductase